MDWLEITVAVDSEAAEAVAEVLSRHAPNAVAIERRAREGGLAADESAGDPLEPTVFVRAYLPIDAAIDAQRSKVAEALWHLSHIYPVPEPTFREVSPNDWENAWKEHYPVLRIGSRFVIQPSWRKHEAQPGDPSAGSGQAVIIELDPGMAFGTGLHPTTQMCLQVIEARLPAGARVIDLGTGSGILAIAAAKLGASSVLALDIDPVAVETARENAQRNRVDGVVRVATGSLDFVRTRHWTFDFGLVNILAKIIIQLCNEGLAEIVIPGGLLICAGLIDTQESDVRKALEVGGLSVIDRIQDKDWVGLVCRRESRY